MCQRFTEGVIFARIMYVSWITSDARRYLAGLMVSWITSVARRYLLSNVLRKAQV